MKSLQSFKKYAQYLAEFGVRVGAGAFRFREFFGKCDAVPLDDDIDVLVGPIEKEIPDESSHDERIDADRVCGLSDAFEGGEQGIGESFP